MKIMSCFVVGAALFFLQPSVLGQTLGTKQWEITIGQGMPRSSPAIGSDGTIYVGSPDAGLKGRFNAINPNGTIKWTRQTAGEIRSSPAIGASGEIYFGSLDGTVWSLNPDGTTNWTVQTTGMQVCSSPAIASDGTIFIGFGGTNVNNLLALNSNGTTNWVFAMGGRYPSEAIGLLQFPSPAIGSDGTIYVGSLDKNFYAINPDGTTNWVFNVGTPMYGSPTIGSDGTVYFGAENGFYAFTPDGRKKWHYPINAVESTAAIGLTNNLYFGAAANGGFSRLDSSGQGGVIAPGTFSASPAIASDGTIYIPRLDGILYAMTPSNNSKWTRFLPASVIASPVIASDGTIYVVAGSVLYALYETNPPLSSASPMFRRNAQHTARAVQVALKNTTRLDDGNVKMDLHIEPNLNYSLQATTNFVDWLELTNFLSTSLSSQFIDDTATNYPARYYRLTSP